MQTTLFTPLQLPNGSVIPNRIAKAAMEENLAEPGQLPGSATQRLYGAWADGGVGLMITGNVMIDHRALTGPGTIVLEAGTQLEPFRQWAQAARRNGAQIWMQISHPGRQVMAAMGGNRWAPSAVALDMGKHSKLFGTPQAMSAAQIGETIQRFVATAQQAQRAGFNGVQIHAAHGYLISQFLSPLTNQRNDQWGGSIENRARLLIEVVRAVRGAVAADFCVAVKLNSADFQRGGFDENDARAVVQMLNAEAVDLIELSGGSYEAPAMQGRTADGRTLAREAYFLDFARDIAAIASMPVMTTGGIRRRAVAQQVIDSGIAMAGIGTALAMQPQLPAQWRQQDVSAPQPQVGWNDKVLNALATMAMVRQQLRRLGAGKAPKANASPALALVCDQLRAKRLTGRYRRWLVRQNESQPGKQVATQS